MNIDKNFAIDESLHYKISKNNFNEIYIIFNFKRIKFSI